MNLLPFLLVFLSQAARPSERTDHSGKSRVREYNSIFPDEFLALLEADCHAVRKYESTQPTLEHGKYKTRWLEKGAEPRTALEVAVLKLAELAKPGNKNVGYEWWVQYVAADETGTIGFHVDKDESIASLQHYLSHPEYASIFYLTDVGGPTLIIDQYSPSGNGYHPLVPKEGELSFPKRGKYVVFNGDLLHGVTPGRAARGEKRMTFLINYWNHKPLDPNCEYLPHKKVEGLKLLSKAEVNGIHQLLARHALKPQRRPIASLDLTNPSSGKPFTVKLPGGGEEQVILPVVEVEKQLASRGATITLIWEKTQNEKKKKDKNEKKKKDKKKEKKKDEL